MPHLQAISTGGVGKTIVDGLKNNNTGRIKNGGSVASGLVSNSLPGLENRVPGTSVHEGRNATRALTGGTFQYLAEATYVIKGANHTTALATVAKTAMTGAGSDVGVARSIHQVTQVRNNFLVTRQWSASGSGNVLNYTDTISSDRADFGADNEADSSRALPGEFTYQQGSNTPVNANYSAKTG